MKLFVFMPTHYALIGCNKRSTCTTKYYFAWKWEHPLYIPSFLPVVGLLNDVALLRLKTPFTASTYPSTVRPVCLPSWPSPPWGFQPIVQAGWGKDQTGRVTDDLKYVSHNFDVLVSSLHACFRGTLPPALISSGQKVAPAGGNSYILHRLKVGLY
jgi:hypothetical protein